MNVAVTLFCASLFASVIGKGDHYFLGSNSSGQFKVLHSPSSLKFYGTGTTLESLLKEIISAALGLSTDEDMQWRGLYVINPFNTPEAVLDVFIDCPPNLGNHEGLISYPLAIDEYEPNIFETVKMRIKRTYGNGDNILMNIKLYDPQQLSTKNFVKVFGEYVPKVSGNQTLVHLNDSVEVDHNFLTEHEALKFIAKQVWAGVVRPDNLIDFYNIHLRSLHTLSNFHGPNSAQMIEAFKLLDDAVQELCRAFVKAYDGSVLVTTIMIDVAYQRRAIRSPDVARFPLGEQTRQDGSDNEQNTEGEDTTAESTTTSEGSGDDDNDEPDPNFSVIFNIMLGLGLAYIITMISVVVFVMDMDPGRDSVVYRMSNIKAKKDI